MENTKPVYRYPIQIQIATLITGLLLILGSSLAWYNYQKSSEIIYSASHRLFEQIHEQLTQNLKITYEPIQHSLSLMAFIDQGNNKIEEINQQKTDPFSERLNYLPLFHKALEEHPAIAGLQIGYDDGDYFIVRRLDANLSARFNAPSPAVIMADHIDQNDSEPSRFERVFFNNKLEEISRQTLPSSNYDPRTRPWYQQAIVADKRITTNPYLFFFMQTVGITIAQPLKGSQSVIAVDVTLQQLSETVAKQHISPSAEVIIVNPFGEVLAYKDPTQSIQMLDDNKVTMSHLSQLESPVLGWFEVGDHIAPKELNFSYLDKRWIGGIRKVGSSTELGLLAIIIAPRDELLAEAISIRWQSAIITLLILLFSLPLAWLVAKRISTPLKTLAAHAGAIKQLNFNSPLHIKSVIKEVDELAESMREMAQTISRFLNLTDSLAREKNFDDLQTRVLIETREICHADAALLYLIDEKEAHLVPSQAYGKNGRISCKLPLIDINNHNEPLIKALQEVKSTNHHITGSVSHPLASVVASLNVDEVSLVSIPLRDRQQQSFGLLCLIFTAADTALDTNKLAFVNALSGFAAVSLESKQLALMQKRLLDAFIKLIAGAIDAKSPYTGGHCQRVPELTRMLCRAAHDSNSAPYTDFHLSDDEWEALDIASWLHDCGKVTTPEFVVDKATKLETLYDRIHEIRMRFEVLKRDAQLDYWIALHAGGDETELAKARNTTLARLDEEFVFIAKCNEGGEFMSEQKMLRLEKVARQTWLRTLDDSIGISWEESQRKKASPPVTLPVQEPLLANKQDHIIKRPEGEQITDNNPYGFKIDTPEYKYNRGELYNLTIAKGTLNNEERYMINDHIVQTIIMLEKLPYPRHLREVPSIAGGHHEKMDGSGYPKRLVKQDLSISARIMAIADIFEALTASDRPYKTPKSLSESLKIMNFMAQDQHIDPELYKLFLSSGVYQQYAQKYLAQEQIDEVDINQYLEQ